ncbi:U6 snRNA-associated Sm-like protein LSm1 [Trichinella nelsoni]|uniref:U6 snRNA-associated Sm-like protein LSm1 n=7 Tax=Trichinella TaxID=6333 RepID=A0A0V1L3H6_9BILA|nr:putative LSM domain protein [Trichinella spiralis]KRX18929.1 U6 snRNA-associated Sm-like protein LSm1 [Trichinella nelsoni]KRX35924.1 U6 snRNA-associated Sm-like protein LSm1 [Trichinella murrelli]KRX52664.1 U6 snRNA-associated Sm-like protein LSm1 [Trichinella sp. T9]KRY13952.1 U6 snRNA-associated Sm-like protein LSm1 [Trichinella patagoniensis]KRY45892.1 U6 snRNA-associated Sm-like protein LSm1 [Trichinella britovi]KRZ54080.1 U6 snRNA-associated Sm-like protein LSm1 [Trichinella nativa]
MMCFEDRLFGAASLLEDLNKKVLVILRDGRNMIGYLRSVDQFANIVLEDTVERIVVNNMYSDISMGLFIVRGENVFLVGELDQNKPMEEILTKTTIKEAVNLQAKKEEEKKKKLKEREEMLKALGLFQPSYDILQDDTY